MPRKLTHEQFLEKIKEVHKDKIIINDMYMKNNLKVKCVCVKCNNNWEMLPSNLMRGQGCPICNSKQKTHEQFCKELEDKYKGKIVLLGIYKNAYTKIEFKCNDCGNIFNSTPSTLLQGGDVGCKKCVGIIQSKQFAKTQEQFESELKAISPHITVLSEYKNLRVKVKCKCNEGHEWETTPQILLNGSNCPICNLNNSRKTHSKFMNELYDIHKNNIGILSNYKNNQTHLKCRCNIDGYEWKATPSNLLRGKGCPVCCGNVCIKGVNDINTTHPELTKYFKDTENAFKYSHGSDTRVYFKCDKCGYEKEMQVKNIVNFGFSCDLCSDGISVPNKFTANLLKELTIDFETEKVFDWAKDKRYDIYINDYNGKSIIIENHGLQHYEGGFNKDKSLIQENDTLKRELALLNDIDLYIEIPYNNRVNTFESCINSIINSDFVNLFNTDNIKWKDVWDKCCTGMKFQAWVLWNALDETHRNTRYIGKILGLDKGTIRRYINEGSELGKIKG